MTSALTVSVREVAQVLSMSESSVYDHVRQGDIPNVGVGAAVRIPRRWLIQRFKDAGQPLPAVLTVVAEGTFV